MFYAALAVLVCALVLISLDVTGLANGAGGLVSVALLAFVALVIAGGTSASLRYWRHSHPR